MTTSIVDILSAFAKNGVNANEFERMAIFMDNSMKEIAQKMRNDLDKFIETGEYRDYLDIKSHFEYITKSMNSRDSFIAHNPDRGSKY